MFLGGEICDECKVGHLDRGPAKREYDDEDCVVEKHDPFWGGRLTQKTAGKQEWKCRRHT